MIAIKLTNKYRAISNDIGNNLVIIKNAQIISQSSRNLKIKIIMFVVIIKVSVLFRRVIGIKLNLN